MALTNASLRGESPEPLPNVNVCGCDDCEARGTIKKHDGTWLCIKHANEFVEMKGEDFDAKHYKKEPT